MNLQEIESRAAKMDAVELQQLMPGNTPNDILTKLGLGTRINTIDQKFERCEVFRKQIEDGMDRGDVRGAPVYTAEATDAVTAKLRAVWIAKEAAGLNLVEETESDKLRREIDELKAMMKSLSAAKSETTEPANPADPVAEMSKDEATSILDRYGVQYDKRLGPDKLRALVSETLAAAAANSND